MTTPQDVIDEDDTAAFQLRQNSFVVVQIVCFISIDKYQIKRPTQLLKRIERRSFNNFNLVAILGALKKAFGKLDASIINIKRGDLAARGQAFGHRQRRVAGKHANFQHIFGTANLHHHLQETPLKPPGEHLRILHLAVGFLDKTVQQRAGWLALGFCVFVDTWFHQCQHGILLLKSLIYSRFRAIFDECSKIGL